MIAPAWKWASGFFFGLCAMASLLDLVDGNLTSAHWFFILAVAGGVLIRLIAPKEPPPEFHTKVG